MTDCKRPLLFTSDTIGSDGLRRLMRSIDSFAGECREWDRLLVSPAACPPDSVCDTSCLELRLPETLAAFPFAHKVACCAAAEELALREGNDLLIWAAADLLFLAPPRKLLLKESTSIALRPVHHRNVGLGIQEPLDPFWLGVCHAVEIDELQGSVHTFVEQEEIRPYYNSHLFSLRPELGLCAKWWELFMQLVLDPGTADWCSDELHRIFLHQALLSALICKHIPEAQRVLLPACYSYPYNLQEQIPLQRRAQRLEDLVCLTWETRDLHPENVSDLQLETVLRDWLLKEW